jgi:hypothetical protein
MVPFRVVESPGYIRSQVSLKEIGYALRLYHDFYGTFPPAVVRDKQRKPLYSWRVLILPFLDEQPIYDEFGLNEAWDSPHPYRPALGGPDQEGLTRYQVLVGPGTAFERDGLTLKDFPDGLANTILVVEAAEPVPWSKAVDLSYHQTKPLPELGGLFTKPVHLWGYEVSRKLGFNALFADGTVRFIPADTDEHVVRALITRNGGEAVDLSKLN